MRGELQGDGRQRSGEGSASGEILRAARFDRRRARGRRYHASESDVRTAKGAGEVASLHVYPLKSGFASDVAIAKVELEGLSDDRRMMVVDERGRCITAREAPRLLNVRAAVDGAEILLWAAGARPLRIARSALTAASAPVSIWNDQALALDGGDEAAAWLSGFLDRICRLAVKPSKVLQAAVPGAERTASFADTAPLLLTNLASLADLARYFDGPISMARFRANVVIAGADAYAEDRWSRIRIGGVTFDVAGPCDRCVMVNLDAESADADRGDGLLSLLVERRRGADGRAYFGQFLIPREEGRVFVGDAVDVLSEKAPIIVRSAETKPVPQFRPTIAQGARRGARMLHCIGVIDEARDLRTFRFELESGEALSYEAGQFVTLDLNIDGEKIRRNYTLSSSPSRPMHVSITVKRASGGRASNWLHDNLTIGARIQATGPHGRFHLRAATGARKLLLLSAGSGVTPMISIARFIVDAGLPLDLHFHHSARDACDIPYLNELAVLRREARGGMTLSWNLTGARALDESCAPLGDGVAAAPGRIDEAMLRSFCPDLAERAIMCCGPQGFRDVARAMRPLESLFLEESFGESTHASDVADTRYRVTFARSGLVAEGAGATTILGLARQTGAPLQSDCEAGICGACRCRIISGDWRVADHCADPALSVLSAAEKAQGFALACSAQPVGDVMVDA